MGREIVCLKNWKKFTVNMLLKSLEIFGAHAEKYSIFSTLAK